MLIRVRGGNAGIREYLEHGHKAGREYSRNELDERVPLAGNLAAIDHIIKNMESEGQRYLHITLSFKEHSIPESMMSAIIGEFEKFAFAAYQKEEYTFYAEAHNPKILGYTHTKSGERIERLPHIHVVIPLENQITGMYLDPFGRVEYQEKFLDAFQEHINNKFGLASPKDNPSLKFNDASEMFARYGQELRAASTAARELKKEVLREVTERGVETWEDFKAVLAEFGQVTTGNAGKGAEREYFKLKLPGEAKHIRFDDERFKRAFIELSTADKTEAINAVVQREYREAQTARKDPAYVAENLAQWYDTRALEVRHVFNNSKALRAAYKESSPEDRSRMLAELQERNAERNHQALQHLAEALAVPDQEHVPEVAENTTEAEDDEAWLTPSAAELANDEPVQPGNVVAHLMREALEANPQAETNDQEEISNEQLDYERVSDGHARTQRAAALYQSDPATAERQGSPPKLASVRNLSSCPVVQNIGPAAVLLSANAHDHVEPEREASDEVRRAGAGLSGAGGAAAGVSAKPSIDEIRRGLDGARLLAHVSHKQGADAALYEVVKHKDGHDLIKCGTRHYSVNDFLTKELRLSWKEAEPLLRECYAAQEMRLDVVPRENAQPSLWKQFQAWKAREGQGERTAAWETQRTSETERFKAMREAYKAEKNDLYSAWRGKRGEQARVAKAAALSVLRTEYAVKQTLVRADIRNERAAFREQFRSGSMYREFLRKEVEQGNPNALRELRRQSLRDVTQEARKDRSATIGAPDRARVVDDGALLRKLTYQVDRYGDVTYRANGEALFRDERNRVCVFKYDADTLETALRLGMQKCGPALTLQGGDEFKRRCVEVAVERGLKCEFKDADLQRYADELKQKAEPTKAMQTTQPAKPAPVDELRALQDRMSKELRESLEAEQRKIGPRVEEPTPKPNNGPDSGYGPA